MPQLVLGHVSRLLTQRSCAEGVAASLPFGVFELEEPRRTRTDSGRRVTVVGSAEQVGYVCLYMPAAGTRDDVLCGFDVLRVKDTLPGRWIAQGDVVRDPGSAALVIGHLSVRPALDEIVQARGARAAFVAAQPAQPPAEPLTADEEAERAAMMRMTEASSEAEEWEVIDVPKAAGGVTAAVLRDVPVGWVHLALAAVPTVRSSDPLMALREALQPPGEPWFGHAVADGADVPRRRPGRPPLADEHLRLVAELVLQEGGAPGVHRRVGKKLGLQPSTVRDHVAAARSAGWLALTSPGRRGATPGPRMLAAWEAEA